MDNDLNVKKEVNDLTEELTTAIKDKTLSEIKPLIEEVKTELKAMQTKLEEKQKAPDEEPIGFKSFGDFIQATVFESEDGRKEMEALKIKKQWDFQMDVGVLGGLTVQERWRVGILDPVKFTPIVRSNGAFVLPSPSPVDSTMHVPVLGQAQDGTMADMVGNWVSESQWKPRADMLFEDIELKPFEYAMYWVITNKMLRNGPMLETFITNKVRAGVKKAEDTAFFSGAGGFQPTGFFGCTAEIAVPRTGPGAIVYADVLNMYNNTIPGEEMDYVFFCSPSARASIIGMTNVLGYPVFTTGDVTKKIPSTLFGIPIIFTDKCAALGAPYDLALTNLNYYLILDGAPLELAFSTHYRFRENKTCFRASFAVDGAPWLQLPILLDDGVTVVSPFITLL